MYISWRKCTKLGIGWKISSKLLQSFRGMIDTCFCKFEGQTRCVVAALLHHVLFHSDSDLDSPYYKYHILISKHTYEDYGNETFSASVILCIFENDYSLTLHESKLNFLKIAFKQICIFKRKRPKVGLILYPNFYKEWMAWPTHAFADSMVKLGVYSQLGPSCPVPYKFRPWRSILWVPYFDLQTYLLGLWQWKYQQ